MAVGLVVAAVLLRQPAHVDPRRAYADATTAFSIGNYSAARNHAKEAIAGAPRWAAAQLMLARAYLQLGDGLAAEAALTHAHDAGMPLDRLRGYRAQSRFLQGDGDGALDEAAKAPADDPPAIRVRARVLAMQGHADEAAPLLARLDRVPGDGEAWVDLGRIRLAAGDVGGAGEATARALRLRPGDPVALTLQGELVRTRYGLIASLPWFEAALARDAYYHPALIEYAATLGDAGRYADMLAATRKALAARPGSVQALYLQAVLAVRAGRAELARDLLDRLGGRIDELPGALLLAGDLAYAGGKDEVAIRDWRALVDRQPMNMVARRLLGAALLRSGDAAGALDALRPMALRGDADGYTLTLAARAFEASGDRAAAAALLDRAGAARGTPPAPFATDVGVGALEADVATSPTDPNYVLGLIRGQLGSGDAAGAIDRARRMAAAAPGAPAAQLALGDALAVVGRDGEAAIAYARAADLAFDEPTMLRLVDILDRTGKRREAAATLALYLGQNPQSVVGRRLLGHWQVENGSADAIETLEGVRRSVGNRDAALLADLALAYAAAGDGAVAHRYGRAAYDLAPGTPAVADAYGVALASAGRVGDARQLLVKAARLDPGSAAIAAHLRQIER